eukprot:172905-Chlamydomonas_euryale.AAC.5
MRKYISWGKETGDSDGRKRGGRGILVFCGVAHAENLISCSADQADKTVHRLGNRKGDAAGITGGWGSGAGLGAGLGAVLGAGCRGRDVGQGMGDGTRNVCKWRYRAVLMCLLQICC